MKKSAILASVAVSAALLAAPAVKASEVISVPADMTSYCRMQFPVIRSDTLGWEEPVLDPSSGSVIDFYGPCNYDPTGADETRAQRRLQLRGYAGDGE